MTTEAPYRLLYNNDTTNTVSCVSPWHEAGEPFREEMLVASIEEVADKGVDCCLLSPGMGWVPWWQSTVEPDFYQWWQARTGLPVTGYARYVHDGGDMVQVLVDTCRRLGMAPLVSLRLHTLDAIDTEALIAVTVNGVALAPCEDTAAFFGNPFDPMISPDGHRRALALLASAILDGRNAVEVQLQRGQATTVTYVDAAIPGDR